MASPLFVRADRLFLRVGLALYIALFSVACDKGGESTPQVKTAEGSLEAAENEEPAEPTVDDLPAGSTKALAAGRQVFVNNCVKCHIEGLGDAPVVLNPEAWQARVKQPKEVLYKHALEGFWGDIGEMPVKGDNEELSDDEVRSAVDYIVSIQP